MSAEHIFNIGDIYGLRKIISLERDENNRKVVVTQCINCGKVKKERASDLLHAKHQSCYCNNRKVKGESGSKLYSIYHNMKYRCYNENAHEYENYGGRGIGVCDLWMGEDGYNNFASWANSSGYEEGLSIDRINNVKGYSPSNCRWVTRSENTRVSNVDNRKQRRKSDSGTYCAISPSGEYIEFENAAQFSREHGLSDIRVRKSCHNFRMYDGWRFDFVANNRLKPQSTIETRDSEGVEYTAGESPTVEAPSTEM